MQGRKCRNVFIIISQTAYYAQHRLLAQQRM
jgi:hypothetical protein